MDQPSTKNVLLSAEAVGAFLARCRDAAADSLPTSDLPSLDSIGQRWLELGLSPGDLVVLALPNGMALLEQFFAALCFGLVPVLVAPSTPVSRLQELVGVLRARALVVARLKPTMSFANRRATVGKLEVAIVDGQRPSLTRPGEAVLLTSGTSGFASGCVFGIEQLLLNAQRHADSIGQSSEDTVLVNLPLHYSFALVAQALATFVRQGRLVIDGPPFQADRFGRTIANFGVTVSSVTPVFARLLLQSDLAEVDTPRVLSVGGDSLSSEQVDLLLRQRPGKELYLTYGLSQAGPRVTTLAAHAEPAHRYGSVGRPLAGTSVFLREVAGQLGMAELCVSSATVMRRRIGLVEGRQPQSADSLNAPGMVATGDIFEQDADGYLYFRGRLTDFIVKNGEKVCLAAVRRLASQLPHVLGARTEVIRSAKGEEDFDLKLVLSAPLSDATRLLRTHLRRSEMPRSIQVTVEPSSIVNGHK